MIALEAAARDLSVTVNTVVQAAWALVLAAELGRDDVVFGATVSGRPADLTGVEDTLGLFINTLPVGFVCTETTPSQHCSPEYRPRAWTCWTVITWGCPRSAREWVPAPDSTR